MISVIIPSYKPQGYLEECLWSVFNQDIPKSEYEVIVVLNGEKNPFYDNIKSLLDNYTNARLIYSEIAGVSNARNLGLDNAHGEYICFIDDDDIISSSYLKNLLAVSSPNAIGHSYVHSFKVTPEILIDSFFICEKQKNIECYKLTNFYQLRSFLAFPVAKLIHRNIIGNHYFDSHFANGEDALFITSITDNLSSLNFTSPDTIYYVREREGSATRKKMNVRKISIDTIRLIYAYISIYVSNIRKYNLLLFLSRIPAVLKNSVLLYKNNRRISQ